MKKNDRIRALLALLSLFAVSCGGGSDGDEEAPPGNASSNWDTLEWDADTWA